MLSECNNTFMTREFKLNLNSTIQSAQPNKAIPLKSPRVKAQGDTRLIGDISLKKMYIGELLQIII